MYKKSTEMVLRNMCLISQCDTFIKSFIFMYNYNLIIDLNLNILLHEQK